MFFAEQRRLIDLALKHRLPMMLGRGGTAAGGLMSYGPDLNDLYRRSATYVDKILKGAKPADLPVEQASRFELVVNLMTAKVLGLGIPQSVLIRADEVIQQARTIGLVRSRDSGRLSKAEPVGEYELTRDGAYAIIWSCTGSGSPRMWRKTSRN